MKTFILQYKDKQGKWQNYLADDKSPIEFVAKIAADTVARDLAAFADVWSGLAWQTVDSTGEKAPVVIKNDI